MLVGSDKVRPQHLQGHVTVQGVLECQVDLGHTSYTQAMQDGKSRDRLPCQIFDVVVSVHAKTNWVNAQSPKMTAIRERSHAL